jgi:hypothetical protein
LGGWRPFQTIAIFGFMAENDRPPFPPPPVAPPAGPARPAGPLTRSVGPERYAQYSIGIGSVGDGPDPYAVHIGPEPAEGIAARERIEPTHSDIPQDESRKSIELHLIEISNALIELVFEQEDPRLKLRLGELHTQVSSLSTQIQQEKKHRQLDQTSQAVPSNTRALFGTLVAQVWGYTISLAVFLGIVSFLLSGSAKLLPLIALVCTACGVVGTLVALLRSFEVRAGTSHLYRESIFR